MTGRLGGISRKTIRRVVAPLLGMPHPVTRSSPSSAALPALQRLPILLRRAWYGLNQGFRQRIQHLGITPDQFSILRWLSEGDPQGLTQRALAALMASDPNTITSTLARMEKAGLLKRHPHESDRRAHRVKILAPGRKVFERARDLATDLQDGVLTALPAGRRGRFLEELAKIAETCTALAEKSARGKKRENRARPTPRKIS